MTFKLYYDIIYIDIGVSFFRKEGFTLMKNKKIKRITRKLKRIYSKKPALIIIPAIAVLLIIIALVILLILKGSGNKKTNIKFNPDDYKDISFSVNFGTLKDVTFKKADEAIICEAKIKIYPLGTNQETVTAIYSSAKDIIYDKQCDVFDEVSFFIVAKMEAGTESKVMSFDLTRDTIELIKKNDIPCSQYGNYVKNLFVFPALRD